MWMTQRTVNRFWSATVPLVTRTGTKAPSLPAAKWSKARKQAPLLAVALAIITRRVLVSLGVGIVAGSLLLPGGSMTLPEEPEKMGWTVLRVCAVLPLGEELIFRGGVQRLLRPLGPGVALAGQAVLFAAAHGSAEAKIYAFAMGLVFGWAVEHTGRLWPGMGLHCLNNCIVLAGCLAERGLG